MRNERKKIYYTDETWLNEGHTRELEQDTTVKTEKEAYAEGLSTGLNAPSGKEKVLIIAHIGSTEGFLAGGELIFEAKKSEDDYHSEMDAHNYENWFSQILTKVESGCVIVLDNASYHSRKVERVPTTSTKKADIQNWLQQKKIPFDISEVRTQLLQKVKLHKHKYEAQVIDEMAKEKGVTVLRLPPYHCELNPIQLIWAQVKGYVASKNKTFKLSEIKALLSEALATITAEKWQSCIKQVEEEEKNMRRLDGIVDDMVERFIINVGESSSEESEDEDSDE